MISKKTSFPNAFGLSAEGIFQVVNSTDLRDVKYIFKLYDVILDFSVTALNKLVLNGERAACSSFNFNC